MICTLHTQERGIGAEAHSQPNEQFNYVLQGTLMSDIEGDRVFASRGRIMHIPGSVVHTGIASPDEDVVFLAVRDTRTEALRVPPVPGTRYVYNMGVDTDRWQGTATSAAVTADADLRLPPGIRGKLLTGERLHVGVLRFEPGATLNNYRRDNEQLVFVVSGDLEIELEDEHLEVRSRSMLHLPAGTRHELYAPHEAVVVLVQDKRAG